ncbi:MFS transporter [Candidatus Dojkabacteria bacterium]|uniref:MFS transporter n=1 Tax=Candidatus Dojkabacteria bacterium TaxID=2099670 RepID=A0A955RKN3_9BACT|nr:MFS transporter [Candidatus Dojkabacteria bacterium]
MLLRDKRYLTIFLIQITEVLGFSLILPFLPLYAEELGASPLLIGVVLASFSLFQFLSAPILGRLSDLYGRKPILIISQISTLLGFLMLGFADTMFLVFLSRAIDGIFGSNFTVTQAYLSDISSKEERSAAFGISGIAFGIGFLFGPAIGGYLVNISFSLPAFLAAGMTILTIILTVTLLRETIKPDPQRTFQVKILDTTQFKKYFKNNYVRTQLLKQFIFTLASFIFITSLALYANRQIGLDSDHIGYVLAYVGLISIIFRGGILRMLIKKFGESLLQNVGFITFTISLLLLAFVNNWIGFICMITLFSISSGLLRPLIIGAISRAGSDKEQGAIIGVSDGLTSVAQIIGPLVGNTLLNYFFPGIIGIAASLISLCAVILVYKESRQTKA